VDNYILRNLPRLLSSFKWVCFGVEYPTLCLTRYKANFRVREDKVEILHHLCKPEAFHKVRLLASVDLIDVTNARKSTISSAGLIDSDESIPGPVPVRFIPSDLVRMIITLNHFRTQIITTTCYIKPIFWKKLI